MSPVSEQVLSRLDAARQKWWIFTLLCTTVLAATSSLALMLLFMLGDALIKFNQIGLVVMFVTWLATTIALLALVFRRLAGEHRSLEATARRIEAEFPELQSDLINLVQFSDDAANGDAAFREAAIRVSAARAERIPFEDAAKRESRWRRFVYCMQTPSDLGESLVLLASLIGLAVLSNMYLPSWSSAANRLMNPWTFVPSVGKVQITSVMPGDIDVLVGTGLEIVAKIKNPEGRFHPGRLCVTLQGEQETSVNLTPDDKFEEYKASIPSIVKPLSYRLEIGDSQTQAYTVKLREKPSISEVQVTFHYPAYLGRPDDKLLQKDADLEGPQFTMAELRIRSSVPVASGHVQYDGQRIAGRVEDKGEEFIVHIPMLKDSTFTIHLVNDKGHTDPDPRVNRIRVLSDKPPTVELLKPGRQETAAPGSAIVVMLRAGDDHGVGKVRLDMKIKPTEDEDKPSQADTTPITKLQEWTKFEGTTTVVLNHRVELTPEQSKAGQTVMLRAVVFDRRDVAHFGKDLGPQECIGPWHQVRLVSNDGKASAAVEQLDGIRAALMKILERQLQARTAVQASAKKKELAQRTTVAKETNTAQQTLGKMGADLAGTIKDSDPEDRRALRKALRELVAGDMLLAVQHSDLLAKAPALEDFDKDLPALLGDQDRILTALHKLLDTARAASVEAMSEMKKRAASEMKDDTKKKLEEIADKLRDFCQQQKKVIEASENLAKKPVEDFSEEEAQLAKALAAKEDDLSKFMQEAANDLAKLPDQDLANATMLKEISEVQTELKLAKESLTAKAVDAAVPLEQLGYEKAQEQLVNLEKWLPDGADHTKWSQEEALTDADKEAPMAELPSELEDLVGDLAEQEEDIMDEAESITSSAIDSLDKGNGWDAADGPISDNSAKGVTGNQLPKNMEIAGRSGEGRQGKSSGEFVGDEAVGKGGRKTPTRLTPDPIVKGQIKDHSKESAGGATGGGKESGEGSEGLQGPKPSGKGPRDLNRLAGKQAALRNKAEGVDVQFAVANFHHTDMKKMLDMMQQVEMDLKAGNYQNVLRQRKVLSERSNNVKQYLKGEFQVRKDTTTNLPAQIQKDILGGMHDPSPTGWEELNRQYFERLANAGNQGAGNQGAPAKAPAAQTPKK